MLDAAILTRITGYVIGASSLMVLVALAVSGPATVFGAAVGGAYAVLNWLAIRWLGRRLMVANDRGRMVWGTLLGAKMVLSMLVVWAILSTGAVDPMGFVIGLGGLVLGILAGAIHAAFGAAGGPGGSRPVSREEA